MNSCQQKFYISLGSFIIDFFLMMFFILKADKSSICNILGFLCFLALPVLFVWLIICLASVIRFCIKNKTLNSFDLNKSGDETAQKRNENKYKEYHYSYENYNAAIVQENKINIEECKKNYANNAPNEQIRIKRAKYENFSFIDFDEKNYRTTVINSEQTQKYKTTLKSCTCNDFKDRKQPCKHMYRLADYCNVFPIYKDGEREIVNKLMILWGYKNLIPYMIDIFYRVIEKKNKYYLKITPNIKKLAELNLILINDIPPYDFVDWNYNANELKGLLYEKIQKKNISKKELIELFIADEKLLKKLPKNIKHVTLNLDENHEDEIIECLNYINYYNK